MADEIELKDARDVMNTICAALDSMDLRYNRDDEKLKVNFGLRGEDVPMDFVILVDAERHMIRLMSGLPFKVAKEKLIETAYAVSFVNYSLEDGCFDFNVFDGNLLFRMTACYIDSLIGQELVKYMLSCACYVIEKYNDRFLMLNKGLLKLSEFAPDKE